jgi:HEXXH motif-containing protein
MNAFSISQLEGEGVDWYRVAAPQADGYDTEVLLAAYRAQGIDIAGLQRRHCLADPHHTLCQGAVSLRHVPGIVHERFANADISHPNIAAGLAYLRHWPAVATQFARLIHTFHPWRDQKVPEGHPGSCSHSLDSLPGVIFGTVNDPRGLAQAFVHEMGHHKLRALGILIEQCDRFILNRPDELYESPIRKDKLRPMTAVFHAQYSFMHVTALDIYNLRATTDAEELARWRYLLGTNLPRMEEGHALLGSAMRLDRAGERLMAGFMDWSAAVLADGKGLMTEAGVAVAQGR